MSWRPTGNGMFVQSLSQAKLTPARIRKRVEQAGLSWVCIQALWQDRHGDAKTYNRPDKIGGIPKSYGSRKKDRADVEAFLEAGVDVVPFAYPTPRGSAGQVVDVLAEYALDWGSPGVVIDPEAEWKARSLAGQRRHATKAALLCEALDLVYPDAWAFTSFGAPWWHESFPWATFSVAPFAIPQTYDGRNNLGPDYPARSHASYRAEGFREIAGAFGTYGAGKTSRDLRTLIQGVRAEIGAFGIPEPGGGPKSVPTLIGWKWETTSAREWAVIAAEGFDPACEG